MTTVEEMPVKSLLNGVKTCSNPLTTRHAWLHYTGDAPLNRPQRAYLADYVPNQTGTERAYVPQNFMLNPNYDPQFSKTEPVVEKVELDKHSVRAKNLGLNVDDL